MITQISKQASPDIEGIISGVIITAIFLGFIILIICMNIYWKKADKKTKENEKKQSDKIERLKNQEQQNTLISPTQMQQQNIKQPIQQTKQNVQENRSETERLNETIQIPIYNKQQIQQYQSLPYYLKDSVMTYHENILFSILSDFCQKYKFVLLSKVRLADFIQPLNTPNRKDYYHWFNRISAKHVDFLVCETETIRPLCAIELDDYTHRYKNRQDRDEFVDNVYRSIKLPILHIYEVREKYVYQELAEALNIQLDKQEAVNNSQ